VKKTKNSEKTHITLYQDDSRLILKLDPKGITWTIWEPEKKVIEIKDKEMLCLALMDVLYTFTNGSFDYELLDKDLYEKYKKFLDSFKDDKKK
jgi:hypothetical protein